MNHQDLTINTDLARRILTGFIRTEVARTGMQRGVIGVSFEPAFGVL